MPLNDERFTQHCLNTLGHKNRIRYTRYIVQQQHKFVPTESGNRTRAPRNRIAVPQRRSQLFRKRGQQRIANHMTQSIVNHLKAIQVEKQYRKHSFTVTTQLLHGLTEPIKKQRAIRKRGERIVQGLMAQLLLKQLSQRNIRHRTRHPGCRNAILADRNPAAQHPQIVVALVPYPVLRLEMGRLPLHMHIQRHHHIFPVLGMNPAQPLFRQILDFVFLVTQHRLPTVAKVNFVRR